MSRFPLLGLALLLLVSLLLAALPLPVLGQGSTVLAVDPAQASVEVNGQREIALLVTDADNLNAFDVQVEYNGDLLTLVKWEFGDLLSNLAVVKRDDLPGSFRLVATQLATPGVSGDGVLLKLNFSGKLEGSSAITITKAEFARSEGGLSLPELQNGRLNILPASPTATPTAVPTATATQAPTATATQKPPTATATRQPPTAAPTNTVRPTERPLETADPTSTGSASGAVQVTQTDPDQPEAAETAAASATLPARATAESGEAVAVVADEGRPPEGGSGGGYFLNRRSSSALNSTGIILFIAGLLAVGIAAGVYSKRKNRI